MNPNVAHLIAGVRRRLADAPERPWRLTINRTGVVADIPPEEDPQEMLEHVIARCNSGSDGLRALVAATIADTVNAFEEVASELERVDADLEAELAIHNQPYVQSVPRQTYNRVLAQRDKAYETMDQLNAELDERRDAEERALMDMVLNSNVGSRVPAILDALDKFIVTLRQRNLLDEARDLQRIVQAERAYLNGGKK